MPSRLAVTLLALIVLPTAMAGESLSPSDKLTRSELVLEVRLPVVGAIPASWPNQAYDPQGWAFPDALVTTGREGAEITRVVVGAGGIGTLPAPGSFHIFGSGSACWWLAHQRGGLRSLVFLEQRDDGSFHQIFGTEQEWGGFTDLEPGYEALVAALDRADTWNDERASAVAVPMRWQDQRAALVSDDPYLLVLARDFLLAQQAASVLDEVWGAAGSQERRAWDAKATWPHDPGSCVAQLAPDAQGKSR